MRRIQLVPDPSQPNAIVASLGWIESILVGSIATGIAIIAFAWLGLLMMTGRIPSRRGAQVILGCFIVFGASTVAAGVRSVLGSSETELPSPSVTTPIIATTATQQPHANQPYDPYAGAALPPRR